MSVWEAVILGAVQGITEFLPVSSSGHLVLLQKIFHIEEPALVFDTAVHAGTLLAVFVVLRRDIAGLVKECARKLAAKAYLPLLLSVPGCLVIATIPAVLAALFFKDRIEAAFETGAFLGFAFLVTSGLLLVSDMLSRRNGKTASRSFRAVREPSPETANPSESGRAPARNPDKMNWIDALVIGLLQALAIIPGISRSGATISGALSRGLDRDFSARFSFLLSIPAILGALVLQIKSLFGNSPPENAAAGLSPGGIGLLPLAAGTLCAGIVAFFSIRLALKIVREHSLRGFALYTAILGILVLIDQFGPRFFF